MYQPLTRRFDALPLVLAGPVVRHCSPQEVSVWLVLKAAREVTLRVMPMDQPDQVQAQGSCHTLALGKHFHMVVVRAMAATPLQGGRLYGYALSFAGADGACEDFNTAVGQLSALVYAPHPLPGFMLPPTDLEAVRLLYGSCRKPHGEGVDAMAAVDQLLEASVTGTEQRPQQLFLSGDQIYADDVADSHLVMIMDAARVLVGEPEALPGGMKEHYLRPGCRERTVHRRAGYTSRFSKSHVLRLSEFLLLYCMVWSDVLWPEELPAFEDAYPRRSFFPPTLRGTSLALHGRLGKRRGPMERLFGVELAHLQRFRQQLPRVRKALANISTYMIFDDHEITDDWYLNRAWTTTVLRKPLGRRAVSNGLVAFALCQGWGNKPAYFEKGPGAELLRVTEAWIAGQYDGAGSDQIETLLGLPDTTEPPNQLDRDVSATCEWDFRVYGPTYEVWVLDTRTWRGFPGHRPTAIPDLISGEGWHQLAKPARPETQVTLVIAPTNVIDVPLTAWVSKTAARFLDVYFADYGDSWEAQTGAFEELLGRLAQTTGAHQSNYVFLSGDVHYAFATRIQYWGTHPYKGLPLDGAVNTVLAQLTSSPLKNENSMTRFLHNKGYWPRFPKPLAWAGWNIQPWIKLGSFRGRLKSFYLGFKKRSVRHEPPLLNLENLPRALSVEPEPDWRYRVDFLHGQRQQQAPAQGLDIVGLNNLGELVFEWSEKPGERAVIQKLWWSDDDRPEFSPHTCFYVDLDHLCEEYPKPELPQEQH